MRQLLPCHPQHEAASEHQDGEYEHPPHNAGHDTTVLKSFARLRSYPLATGLAELTTANFGEFSFYALG